MALHGTPIGRAVLSSVSATSASGAASGRRASCSYLCPLWATHGVRSADRSPRLGLSDRLCVLVFAGFGGLVPDCALWQHSGSKRWLPANNMFFVGRCSHPDLGSDFLAGEDASEVPMWSAVALLLHILGCPFVGKDVSLPRLRHLVGSGPLFCRLQILGVPSAIALSRRLA